MTNTKNTLTKKEQIIITSLEVFMYGSVISILAGYAFNLIKVTGIVPVV